MATVCTKSLSHTGRWKWGTDQADRERWFVMEYQVTQAGGLSSEEMWHGGEANPITGLVYADLRSEA